MKMKCTYRCIANGDLVKPGTIIDVPKELVKTAPYSSSFEALEKATDSSSSRKGEESSDLPEGASGNVSDPIVVAGLTRDQAIAKLRAAKVNVPSNISNPKLVERYEETFSGKPE